MKIFKKYLTCFCIALIIILSSVTFATDVNSSSVNDVSNATIPINEAPTTSAPLTVQSIYKDLYIYNTDSYTLTDIVYGNIFASTSKFTTNPKNNGGTISRELILSFFRSYNYFRG